MKVRNQDDSKGYMVAHLDRGPCCERTVVLESTSLRQIRRLSCGFLTFALSLTSATANAGQGTAVNDAAHRPRRPRRPRRLDGAARSCGGAALLRRRRAAALRRRRAQRRQAAARLPAPHAAAALGRRRRLVRSARLRLGGAAADPPSHRAGALGCIGFVTLAQQLSFKDPVEKKKKIRYMMLHKSCGLLVAALMIPRLGYRLASKLPAAPTGDRIQHVLSNFSHVALYAGLILMPVSGIVMGYFGGKGLPFFGATIPGALVLLVLLLVLVVVVLPLAMLLLLLLTAPALATGATEKDGKLAGKAYKLHKQVGSYWKWVVPVHVGAVGWHALRAEHILYRMNPLLSKERVAVLMATSQSAAKAAKAAK